MNNNFNNGSNNNVRNNIGGMYTPNTMNPNMQNQMQGIQNPMSNPMQGMQNPMQGMQNPMSNPMQSMQNPMQGIQNPMSNPMQGMQNPMQNPNQGMQNPMPNPMQGMQNQAPNMNFNMMMNNNEMMINQIMTMDYNNLSQMYLNIPQPTSITLQDAFENYKKGKYFEGSNTILCQKCGCNCIHVQTNHLYTLPEYFVINLNRGKENMYKVDITFPEIIDLNNEVQTNLDNHKYKLICVVTHIGPHGTGGHYIAYCLLEEKNLWYKFNDSLVTLSSYQEASFSNSSIFVFKELNFIKGFSSLEALVDVDKAKLSFSSLNLGVSLTSKEIIDSKLLSKFSFSSSFSFSISISTSPPS